MKTLLFLAALLMLAAPARAQETGKVGLTFGPNAVGVIFHLNDQVAIRPETNFATTSSDTLALVTWNAGASALFYIGRKDALRMYVVPRFLYGRQVPGSSSTSTFLADSSTYDVSGSFGAQYALHRRFAVYGEVGLDYRSIRTDTSGLGSSVAQTTSGTGTRSGVGAILYFK